MKKILLFTDSLGAGGAQRQLVGLAILLQQAGYNVKVCTYQNIDFYKNHLDSHNIENEIIPHSTNKITRIFAITNYIKRENPNWVIAYQETPSLIACISKLLNCKCKLIVSERNTTQKMRFKEHIRFFIYRYADFIVPNAYAQEKFLVNRYKWMKPKIKTISNFVDLEHFHPLEKRRSQIPNILVVATIWASKNTLGFIEAIQKLAAKKIQFKVQWYGITQGYENYTEQAQSLILKYNLHTYIELLPKTQQVNTKYQECDYFCLPSFYEGTPNVICEAMATGRPIICSNVCDNPIYVKEKLNGFLFNPHSPESIANAIEKAITLSDEEYTQFCHNSRKTAETLLSSNTFLEKYIDILENKK